MGDDIELRPVTSDDRSASSAGRKDSSDSNGDDSSHVGIAVDVKVKGGNDTVVEPLLDDDDESHAIKKAQKKAMAIRLESNEFTGLTKEELEQYAHDPHWRKVRLILFALFWIIWVALLIGAVLIVIFSSKCPPRPDVPFYQKGLIYKVLPLSFAVEQNSDNGWGSLIGLSSKLQYIKSLGASTVQIGPILGANTMNKALYDSDDNNELDSSIGHFLPCLQNVTKEASKQGLKILVEVQINFASVNHSLFLQQINNATPTGGPFLVRKAADVVTSNLKARDGASVWRSVNSVLANATAGYVYYSSFTSDVVEWDFSSPIAVSYAQATVTKLLQQDIDGLVIKDASFLSECDNLTQASDSQPAPNPTDFANNFWKLSHSCTVNQNGSVTLVQQLAQLVKQRNDEEDRRKRVLLVELAATTDLTEFSQFVASGAADGAFLDTLTHVGFNPTACDVQCVRRRVEAVSTGCQQPSGTPLRYPNWQFSTPEFGRLTSRFGSNSAPAMLTLGTFLPGGFSMYYGDEVGMADLANLANLDNLFFDPGFRSAMQWTPNEPYAGFLLPAKPDVKLYPGISASNNTQTYLTANARVHQATGFNSSRISLLRDLVAARSSAESAQWGSFYSLTNALLENEPALRPSLIAFLRAAIGFDPVVVIVNGLGNAASAQSGTLALSKVVCNALQNSAEWSAKFASQPDLQCSQGTVLFSSGSSLSKNATVLLSNVYVSNNNVLVIRLTPTPASK